MNRTLSAALTLAVSGLLVTGATAPAGAAGHHEHRPKPSKASKAEAKQDARTAISRHPEAVRGSGHDTFTARSAKVDGNGTRHVHFSRTYKDLPVLGGDVIVHSAADGTLRETTLSLRKPLSLSTHAHVSAKKAEKTAEKLFRGERTNVDSKLVVDALDAGHPHLAWQVEVDGIAPDQSPSHFNVLIDAGTGKAGQTWNDFHTAEATGHGYQVGDVTLSTTQAGGGYQLKDPTRGGGETRDANNDALPEGTVIPDGWGSPVTSADASFGDGSLSDRQTAAVDAHYGIQETWDYYQDAFGRDGIRNDGVGARSFVHWGQNYANAGWDDDSFAMIYGDGAPGQQPFTELDVAGHEMSHGVTGATAGLVYYGDAGGLNESTSDIFGTLVEFHSDTPGDAPDYLIGEKISGNGTPLRWMDDPSRDGRSVSCWTTNTRNLDPHYSSGVGNHFFYLLAVGSGSSQWGDSPTCNGSTVDGIGNTEAGKVWYRALTTYMTSTTTYPGAREATVKAAIDLFGADSTECATVEKAWGAVDVAPTSTRCGTGTTEPGGNELRNGDFESGATAWNSSSGVITDSTSGIAHSGSWYAWLCGYGQSHTDSLSQAVTVPSGGTLTFYLAISTDEGSSGAYDTLTVQAVTDSGTRTLARYDNTTPTGYTPVTLDLSAYAGQDVTLRFTGSEDYSNATSFLIDDVTLA